MTITLFQYPSGFGVPCPSPFCMKAEILLKMSGVNYRTEIMADPRKAPKGKLPYIADGNQTIADSSLIKRHLEQQHGADFDPGLSTREKAIGHAMARMTEERLYWVTVYSRWLDAENWPAIKQFWFGGMPPVLRSLVPVLALRQVRTNLNAQGIGRHEPEDIYAFGAQDLAALATQLGDQSFLFGDQPTSLDAVVYPAVTNMLIEQLPGPLLNAAMSHAAFRPYVDRCQALWFPDFDPATSGQN